MRSVFYEIDFFINNYLFVRKKFFFDFFKKKRKPYFFGAESEYSIKNLVDCLFIYIWSENVSASRWLSSSIEEKRMEKKFRSIASANICFKMSEQIQNRLYKSWLWYIYSGIQLIESIWTKERAMAYSSFLVL